MHDDLINWTLAGNAFGIGVFSALSLILGAITARFWIPEDRTVAALMAFGGGALLTVIARTMLPEAYLKGGTVVGLSTLAGFIAALFFKTLETGS